MTDAAPRKLTSRVFAQMLVARLPTLANSAVSPLELAVLLALHDGPLTVLETHKLLGVSVEAASLRLRALEKRGYVAPLLVVRVDGTPNQKTRLVGLTPRGTRLLRSARRYRPRAPTTEP